MAPYIDMGYYRSKPISDFLVRRSCQLLTHRLSDWKNPERVYSELTTIWINRKILSVYLAFDIKKIVRGGTSLALV